MNAMFVPSPVQYSCTTIQYSFDASHLPLLRLFLGRLGLVVEKREQEEVVLGEEIVGSLEAEPPGRFGWLSYEAGEERARERRKSSGKPKPASEAVDCYKLLCAAKDVDASVNMCFAGIPPHSGYDYAGKREGGLGRPHWLFAHITDNCNLSCKYCYATTDEKEAPVDPKLFRKFMLEWKRRIVRSFQEEHKRWRRLLGRPTFGVTFGGGEPTTHPRFAELVRFASRHLRHVTVSTNATNVRSLLECAEHLRGVAVSCPFPYNARLARLHPVTTQTIVRAMKKLAPIQDRCLSVIMTSRMKPRAVKRCIDFALQAGATAILFLMYKPLGSGRRRADLLPGLWQARELVCAIIEQMEKYREKPLRVCLDACSLAYTCSFSCASEYRFFRFEKQPVRAIPEPAREALCPWTTRTSWEQESRCPFDSIHRASLLTSISQGV